ncbi:MAG: DUF4160 domain-containing protein [Hungatella sp.]|nr:DUF4160 domain-containing protein [Hungatella sp.]
MRRKQCSFDYGICNNNSQISLKDLRKLLAFIEANSSEIMKKWYEYFGKIRYYC